MRVFAADIYDVIIVWMTATWYKATFGRLNTGDRVLDVGIGTATALVKNKLVLLEKAISVTGIDYEGAYVRKAEKLLKAEGLWRTVPEGTSNYRAGAYYCRVFEKSIYDPDLRALCEDDHEACGRNIPMDVPDDKRFDAAYFSGSISVMPDPPAALRACLPLIKKDTGRIYITQTFQKKPSPVMKVVKPMLKYITTIDFGYLTTESDVDVIIAKAGAFDILENEQIPGSMDTPFQTARLIILRPKQGS